MTSVETDGQRWQDMTARLCEMPREAELQHAQVKKTGGERSMNGQSRVRGQYGIMSIVGRTFDSPQLC